MIELSGSSRFGTLEPGSTGWNHPEIIRDHTLLVKMSGSSRFSRLEPLQHSSPTGSIQSLMRNLMLPVEMSGSRRFGVVLTDRT